MVVRMYSLYLRKISSKILIRISQGKYQASDIGTQKGHFTPHFVEALGEIFPITFMHFTLYEGFQKIFKRF